MDDVHASRADGGERYEIRVRGHLAAHWTALFDGMTLTRHDDGTSLITTTIADQAVLHGLLRRLNDLGVALVSVTPVQAHRPVTDRHHKGARK